MRSARRGIPLALGLLTAASLLATTRPGLCAESEPATQDWQRDFDLASRKLTSYGHNPYFILEVGYRLVLAGEDAKLAITVLDETQEIQGVTTRVVEEREWEDGELIEVSRNYYAIDPASGDVFYFGEDVDVYKDGKIDGHPGAWRAGEGKNQPGLMIPGAPAPGMRYYQEIAPGIAMDRAEVVSLDEALVTPAGKFTQCLKCEEGSDLEPEAREFKRYAPAIGLIQDEDLLLVGHGFIAH